MPVLCFLGWGLFLLVLKSRFERVKGKQIGAQRAHKITQTPRATTAPPLCQTPSHLVGVGVGVGEGTLSES